MKVLHFLGHIFSKRINTPKKFQIFSSIYTFRDDFEPRNPPFKCSNYQKRVYSASEGYEIDEYEVFLTNEQFEKYHNFRNLLFKDSSDRILMKLNNSACVEDVMNIVKEYHKDFKPEHMTQTILVLTDLQTGFYYCNGFCKKSLQDFTERLQSLEGFQTLVEIIQSNLDAFDVDLLSDIFLFINKLGILPEEDIIQEIALKLKNHLRSEFNLGICAKLLTVIFKERSIRPFNISLEFLPKIISAIGKFILTVILFM